MKAKRYTTAMLIALMFATASIQAQSARRPVTKDKKERARTTSTYNKETSSQKAKSTKPARKAQTQQVRKTVAFRMIDQVTQFEALADTLFEAGIDPNDLDQLRELKTSLAANLERIDEFVERRLDSDVEGDKTTRRLLDISKRLRTVETGTNTATDTLPNVNLWKTETVISV